MKNFICGAITLFGIIIGGNAYASKVLISDSALAKPPEHYLRFLPGDLAKSLRCEFIDTDFDGVSDATSVLLSLHKQWLPNVTLSHHRLYRRVNSVEHSLCDKVRDVLKSNPSRIQYYFQLFQSKNELEEILKVKFSNGLELTSRTTSPLFR